jgi:glycerophosphoryl diester phosphodiesterase
VPKSALAQWLPHVGRLGRATRWRRSRGRPRVWAHRGDSAHAPENTMRAFEQAKQKGADGIELDVRFDADKNVIVFHDDALERLTGQPGVMAETSADARHRLRVSGEPIPLLAEVLHAIDLEVNVEIKSNKTARMGELVVATAKVIKDSGRADHILISSFDPFALVQMHRHMPDLALAFLFHQEQPLPLRRGWVGRMTGASLFHPEHTLCTEETMKAWHTAGLPVNAWTVDDADELRRLDALGVDGVFSNDVAHAVTVLSR